MVRHHIVSGVYVESFCTACGILGKYDIWMGRKCIFFLILSSTVGLFFQESLLRFHNTLQAETCILKLFDIIEYHFTSALTLTLMFREAFTINNFFDNDGQLDKVLFVLDMFLLQRIATISSAGTLPVMASF